MVSDELDTLGCAARMVDGEREWVCDMDTDQMFDVWTSDYGWQSRLWENVDRVRSVNNTRRTFML